jgi:poly(hydroxyalkanoate) depolymerase family esterase
MTPIDWRALYASNRAAIERAGVPSFDLPLPLHDDARAAVPIALRDLRRPPHDRAAAAPPADPRALLRDLPLPLHDHTAALRRLRGSRGGRRTGRGALVHVPADLDRGAPVPLVCMLHGCTQDPESFAAATRMNAAADRHGFVVVYPRQERSANAQGCWNWFEPAHQERERGEPAAIARAIGDLLEPGAPATIDRDRVFVAGLSSGGAMAAILAAAYPDLVAAVAVHSGLAYCSATSVGAAFAAMARGGEDPTMQGPAAHAAMGHHARPVPSLVIHGDADATVAPVNAEQVLRQSMAANRLAAPGVWEHDANAPTETERRHAEGGHAFTRSRWRGPDGALRHELLLVHGLGHAWSGGAPGGSYTDPQGPDATEAICRFFAAAVPVGEAGRLGEGSPTPS